MNTATKSNDVHEFTPEEKFNLDVIIFDVEMEEQAKKINQLHKKGIPAKQEYDKAFIELRDAANSIKSYQLQAASHRYNEQMLAWIETIFKWSWAVNFRGKLALRRYDSAYRRLTENIQKLHEILDENIHLVKWAREKNLLDENDFKRTIADLCNEERKIHDYLKVAGIEVEA
jgi:hypothetical protein